MGRRRSELDKAKAMIGDGLSTVAGDVTNSVDLDKLFATVLDKEGGLDILVANSARCGRCQAAWSRLGSVSAGRLMPTMGFGDAVFGRVRNRLGWAR